MAPAVVVVAVPGEAGVMGTTDVSEVQGKPGGFDRGPHTSDGDCLVSLVPSRRKSLPHDRIWIGSYSAI